MQAALHIYCHVYRGNNGDLLILKYLKTFLQLISSSSIHRNVTLFCNGFPQRDVDKVKNTFNSLSSTNTSVVSFFFPSSASELPSLRRLIEHLKSCEHTPNDMVVYMHSKGASYQDQSRYINWSLYSVSALSAAVDSFINNEPHVDLYDSVGSFAGVGVFERYGEMTPAFSGNFWACRASKIINRKIELTALSDLYHNRHQAEGFIGLYSRPELLLNLASDYHITLDSTPCPESVYATTRKRLQEFTSNSLETIASINYQIAAFYSPLVKQHLRYSQHRFAWKLRKRLLGNQSMIRLVPHISKLLDKLIPYTQTELYRHYNGPSHLLLLPLSVHNQE